MNEVPKTPTIVSCVPVRCSAESHDHPEYPTYMLHEDSDPCPLDEVVLPGYGPHCCVLSAKPLLDELDALGQEKLADRVVRSTTCTQARRLGRDLARVAKTLEAPYRNGKDDPKNQEHGTEFDTKRKAGTDKRDPSIALALICEGAKWYKDVGEREFGVLVVW